MQTPATEQGETERVTEGREGGELPTVVTRPPRLLRVRLWQAITGMCLAVTIWLLIVTSELAGRVARQANYMNRRVAALNANVRSLRHQTAVEQRKLGSVRELASAGEVFEKILFAPDLRTIKLLPSAEKEKEKSKSLGQPGGSDLPSGTLAMSESANAAMLEVSGLKPTGTFQVYRIWWTPRRGVPIWAADFLVGDDSVATAPLDLPPGREKKLSLIVTLEDESYSEAPNGPIALRGEPSPLSGSVQNARKSRR